MIAHASRSIWEGTNATSLSETLDAGSATDRVLLVVIRHGSGGAEKTHNTPTYNGVSMTQVGTLQDISTSGVTRKQSVWRLDNPASGSNTLAGGFSAQVSQWSMEAIVVSGADSVDVVGTLAATSTSTPGVTLTANASSSLIYLFVGNSNGNAAPYSPGTGVTEISDSTDAVTVSNHGWVVGYASATGSSQTVDFTANAVGDHCAIAVEVTEAGGGTGIDIADNNFGATFNTMALIEGASNTYEAELLTKGVDYYWPIDEVVGGVIEDKFGGTDLTVAGAPTQITGPTDILTGALRFDGVDDSAEAVAPTYVGDITVLMFLRTQALGQNTHDESVFNSADTQRIGCGAFVQDDVAGTDVWEWHGANDLDAVYDLYGDDVVVDQWEFFATTIQASGARLYQANSGTIVLKASDTSGDITESDFQVFRLMQGRAEVQFGQHDAAGLAIFKSALTLSDIQDIYDASQLPTLDLNTFDGSATFNSPSLAASIDLTTLDASATFNTGQLDSSVSLDSADLSATFNGSTLGGTDVLDLSDLSLAATFGDPVLSVVLDLAAFDGSATFQTPEMVAIVGMGDNTLGAIFNNMEVAQNAIDLNILDGSATFNNMALGPTIDFPDLSLAAVFNTSVIGHNSLDLGLIDSTVFPTGTVQNPALAPDGIYLPLKGTSS